MKTEIKLDAHEIQSGSSRVNWAEGLIEQLPKDHDGRNSWLLNYGVRDKAKKMREEHNEKLEKRGYVSSELIWNDETGSLNNRRHNSNGLE